ncbi:unnamed protein product [marine sediment metagenome]|uniref:Uncharacterized protein n=1 Tax=marine sediment metagenome TaxID=412755 RepID=X1K9F5_9ZZZZ
MLNTWVLYRSLSFIKKFNFFVIKNKESIEKAQNLYIIVV